MATATAPVVTSGSNAKLVFFVVFFALSGFRETSRQNRSRWSFRRHIELTSRRERTLTGTNDRPEGHNVNVHEIGAGLVYKDSNVTVTAFPTKHAMESYGYRLVTPDRTIVVSGDTNPTEATIDACNGCDVLVHEAQTPAWIAARPPTFHPIAPEEVFADMSARYDGEFVVGGDLDIY